MVLLIRGSFIRVNFLLGIYPETRLNTCLQDAELWHEFDIIQTEKTATTLGHVAAARKRSHQ